MQIADPAANCIGAGEIEQRNEHVRVEHLPLDFVEAFRGPFEHWDSKASGAKHGLKRGLRLIRFEGQPAQREIDVLRCACVGDLDIETSVAQIERDALRRMLESCQWNVSAAAARLHISRRTIYRKIHRHGLLRHAPQLAAAMQDAD